MQEYSISIEKVSESKERMLKAVSEFSKKNNVKICDARLEITNGLGAGALNGNIKGAAMDHGADIGVRVFYGKVCAGGFAGKSIGSKEIENIEKTTTELLEVSLKRAKFNSNAKEKFMKNGPAKSGGIQGTIFSEIPVSQESWTKKYAKNPLDANLEDFIKRSEELSKEISKIKGVSTNSISISSELERKAFVNSEGSMIEQTRAITEPSIYIAANGKANETYHEWISEAKGLEALEGENAHGKSLEEFARYLAEGTVAVSNAPTAKFTKDTTIITDPWFNTLLSHEICGHPSEADRALKRETAWAGRAWWFNNIIDNQIGKTVGSKEMTIVSDPGIEGYGNYKFDDEGTPAKRVVNIENGVLKGFMNSRETAHILGSEPNGHMRATSAAYMPLIRMSNTYFEKGSWKADELIAETKEGFYIIGEKTPSIGESRQNFNITCWKCYRVENGEKKELLRSAGVEYDSRDMFMTIEAANDVKHFNVPNCGKGTPMQTMKLGNGGPHLRFKANLTGGRK